MFSVLRLWIIAAAAVGWIATHQTPGAAQESTSNPPSWLTGVPLFNGDGYDTPPIPVPRTPVPNAGYQLPTAGQSLDLPPETNSPMNALPMAGNPPSVPSVVPMESWEQGFGLSEVQFEQPVRDLPLVDPGATTAPAQLPIGQAVSQGETIEAPPLEEEVVRWYQVPWRWISKGWENHAEFGLDGSSGNADTLAIQTGLEMKRKTDAYTLALDFDYRQASANNQTTEDNGRFNLDYDRLMADSNWSLFGKFGMEYDEFKAFDLRINVNSGVGYYWLRNDRSNLVTRFGAGASKEIGAVDDDWKPEAVFGLEADHQLTARQKVKAKIDYFPAWSNFSDYRLVTDLAWETLLDSSDNLSLRIALTDRYDSTPQGAEPNDFYYSVLLLYKF